MKKRKLRLREVGPLPRVTQIVRTRVCGMAELAQAGHQQLLTDSPLWQGGTTCVPLRLSEFTRPDKRAVGQGQTGSFSWLRSDLLRGPRSHRTHKPLSDLAAD